MKDKKGLILYIAILLLCTGMAAGIAYKTAADKTKKDMLVQVTDAVNERDELLADRKLLQELNRSSISNMVLEDGEIYVIGHKNPDSDTVCSAIAYARLLNELGYAAKPAVTMPVKNETAYILEQAGMEEPEVLYDASGLNIILVDHSEYAQAADGMEDAHIVGILDHHGVGTVSTGNQVVYQGRPIGATATIVWLDYLNYGVEIDRQTAQVLLGAILSDTYYLTSSTTTEADRKAIETLSQIAEVDDVDGFYQRIRAEDLSYKGMTDEEILFGDYKEYEASGTKFGIGLARAIDDEAAVELAKRMKTALEEYGSSRDVDLIYCSIGVYINEINHDYIIPGNELSESVLKNAFPDYRYDGTSYLYENGLGRKTIFVPGLTDYLAARPHE